MGILWGGVENANSFARMGSSTSAKLAGGKEPNSRPAHG